MIERMESTDGLERSPGFAFSPGDEVSLEVFVGFSGKKRKSLKLIILMHF